jgi:predicted kinase
MDAIMLIGIQASGKSTFYRKFFFNSHLRISNDLLKTKHRTNLLLDYCFKANMSCVVDNTNFSKATREKFIKLFKQNNCRITGYYFKTNLKQSLKWNKNRSKKEVIPTVGIYSAYKNLELPTVDEGFDHLYYVEAVNNDFIIKNWNDEI